MLDGLPKVTDPRLLVGTETFDDAGVVRLDDEHALVQTVDFFTPIVDEPFDFGRIAAANALSDVYAMGGVPLSALAVCIFPQEVLPLSALRETLAGGLAVLRQANVLPVGGHTIKGVELTYGLAVTGLVHPEHVLTNAGARVGDVLMLTKPLGTGVLATALKAEQLSAELTARMVASMVQLNATAAAATTGLAVHALTDITGYGLLGHLLQMAKASGVSIRIGAGRVPLLDGARDKAAEGFIPGGLIVNRDWVRDRVDVGNVDPLLVSLLCDPQTSGGLAAAIGPEDVDRYRQACAAGGVQATAIGVVTAGVAGTAQLV